MKPYHAVLLFVAIVCCAVLSSVHNYGCAKDYIVADMNQALAKTLAEKRYGWITPDTIADYRSHLAIAELRRTSVISYAVDGDGGNLKSRKMAWGRAGGRKLEFQGFANCSMASVFAMSDQRLPLSLYALAALWAFFSVGYFRRVRHSGQDAEVVPVAAVGLAVGGLRLDPSSHRFFTPDNAEVALTPMQSQLLTMFFQSDGHRLSKQEICAALWPKKPDASDTLYTLIRRIKPILAEQGLTITTGRGKDYELNAD